MRSILVTGGAGFIGSNFVKYLVDNTDVRVTVLDRLSYAGDVSSIEALSHDRVDMVVGDITDPSTVDPLVAEHDATVNLAAETHNDNSLVDPAPFVATNVVGTFTVLEAVRKHKTRLHHVSTDEVYGDLPLTGGGRFYDRSRYRPSSPYAATKAGSDHLVNAWVRSFDVNATISVCSNNYGPWQHIEKFVPRQITNVLTGRRPRLYGTGKNVRDWIHVEDHASALWRILEGGVPGETYPIAAECEAENVEVVRTILRCMGHDENEFEHVNDRPGHDRRYALDPRKMRRELGWAAERLDFTEGINQTIEWYRSKREWWGPVKEQVEAQYRQRGQ